MVYSWCQNDSQHSDDEPDSDLPVVDLTLPAVVCA